MTHDLLCKKAQIYLWGTGAFPLVLLYGYTSKIPTPILDALAFPYGHQQDPRILPRWRYLVDTGEMEDKHLVEFA
jgi:hypothetical protein